MTARGQTSVLEDYIAVYENLAGADLQQLDRLVTPDIRFKDPFNDLRGVEAFRKLLRKTLDEVEDPHFEVLGRWHGEENRSVMLKWRFSGRVPVLGLWRVEGASQIDFAADGRICSHIDFWDAAEGFYARLPLIGPILRRIGRRLAV